MKKRLIMAVVLATVGIQVFHAQNSRPLDIQGLFTLIDTNNSSMRVSKTSIEAARHDVEAAKSQRFPDINAQLSASFIGNALLTDRDFSEVHGLHSPHFGNQFIVDASQTIYSGGALTAGIKMSELGLEKAGIASDLTIQQQRFLALSQYLDLEKIANREQVVKSNIELTKKIISDIEARHLQGVALKNDITRYELQMQTLQLELTKLRNQRAIVNHQLCVSLGIATSDSIVPTEHVADKTFARDAQAQWQSAAMSSPTLRMASVDEQMAGQKEKLAKSELLPKVAVVAQNNFNGPITFELPPVNKNLNIWYVGVGVSYPVSSLFKSNKKLRAAKVAVREALERKTVAQELVGNQMQAAWTNYQQSYVELQTQQKSVELARQNFEVVNDRYINQLALVTDMIDASNMRLDAELAEVDARINIAYAYYKMKYIAGEL
jgi:outer membrane protein